MSGTEALDLFVTSPGTGRRCYPSLQYFDNKPQNNVEIDHAFNLIWEGRLNSTHAPFLTYHLSVPPKFSCCLTVHRWRQHHLIAGTESRALSRYRGGGRLDNRYQLHAFPFRASSAALCEREGQCEIAQNEEIDIVLCYANSVPYQH